MYYSVYYINILVRKISGDLPKNSEQFSKITKDFRGITDDVSVIQ